ncbi:lytic murein transglycosylase B [Neisseria meningitidis]|uniref:lytic murein transglycosylase B n=1 Tax=Neisseria meningitidis TaxID=487 RepID=UPI0039896BEB
MKKRKILPLAICLAALSACTAMEARPPRANEAQAPRAVEMKKESRPAFDAAAVPVSDSGFAANANVRRFVDDEVGKGDFSRAEWQDFFDKAAYKADIVKIMHRPSTSRPWYVFRTGNSGKAKFRGARRFYAENRALIDDVAQKYGVPAELIVAVIGIETNYGKNTGSFRVADALATLGFDYPRRAGFFQKELVELLKLAKEEGGDVFAFKGSYAGAMGMPQFMPSSYRKWAVDYDGDGHRDIWGNVGDVAASVANYMKQHGWRTGGKMLVSATLAPGADVQAIIGEKTALTRTVADLKAYGIIPGEELADDEKAVLFKLETAPGVFEYYLGLNNFYTVWQYNHSRMYVTAVRDIANSLGGPGL